MKPHPPKDLWAQMDNIREKYEVTPPPAEAFTLREYSSRYGLTPTRADAQLKKLCSIGTIKRVGIYNRNVYFQLADSHAK